jgi:hypothetical protein
MSRNVWTAVLVLGCLAAVLVACGRGRTPVPAGAQVVHIVAVDPEVQLDRTTVRAGDVYMVLDTPRSSVGFAFRQRGSLETGPLSDDDIARLALGDSQGLGIAGWDLGGCSDEQRAEDRGYLGYCGNVFKEVLVPGKYAFLGPAWDVMMVGRSAAPTAGPPAPLPPSIAVLQVLP